ncbi:MAG: hypothetical protein WKF75_03890, partial [Singulisphaera sp.]
MVGGVLAVPRTSVAHLLRGRILERRGRIDDAIAAYRRAWDRGIEAALPRLVDLLAQRKRFDDLAQLGQSKPNPRLDRLSAQAVLRLGDKDQARRFVMQAGSAQAGADAWQARMLALMGRAEEAEAVLRASAGHTPKELGPWLAQLRFQAGRGRMRA